MNHLVRKDSDLMRVIAMLLIIAFINLTIGCNYYKVRTFDSLTAEMSKNELQKYQNFNKYIILHYGSSAYHISVDKVDADKQMLYCFSDKLPVEHQVYHSESEGNMRYKNKKGEGIIKHEVHIYTNAANQTSNAFEIPLKSITRIDVIEADQGKTIASHFFGALGIVAGVAAILLIIIALTKSSCPFVYVQNGTEYDFKGEIYGGAIFKPLQRDDYMHLKTLTSTDSVLNIRIANELKEIQYTDVANIILAEHSSGVEAMIDNKGVVHTIDHVVLPQSAMLNGFKNEKTELMKVDSSSCLFEATNKPHSMNELTMQFEKPETAQQAKLILHAQNSLFLDFAFTEFTKLFGMKYNTFIEKQNQGNRDSLQQWGINQGLPLSVYVKKNGEWKLVERINTVGPLAARNICVPIDISDLKSKTLEVKLACGYMFWELDYAAVSFADNEMINTFTIKPDRAIEQNGNDATARLSAIDNKYLIQPKPGDVVDISYKLPTLKKEKTYDAFLMTNGYYNHVRDYDGIPDKNYLMTFKQEGAFIDFAKLLQDKMMKNYGLASAK